MKKIELYRRVVLTSDYEIEDITGVTIYKKGLTGTAIDYGYSDEYVIVEIDSNKYEDKIPAFPAELLSYL